MSFKDRLKEARINKNFTQEQLATKIGVAKSTVTGYEKGNSEPNMLTVSRIMEALSIDANFLWQDEMGSNFPKKLSYDELKHIDKYRSIDNFGRETVDYILERELERFEHETPSPREEPEQYPDSIIPMFSPRKKILHRIGAAGAGVGEIADNIETVKIDYPADKVPDGTDYTIDVTGDSMEPTYSDGDVLFCQRGGDDLRFGDVGIFIVDGDTLVKEYGKDGLISHNKKYDIMKIDDGQTFKVEGKVLGKL